MSETSKSRAAAGEWVSRELSSAEATPRPTPTAPWHPGRARSRSVWGVLTTDQGRGWEPAGAGAEGSRGGRNRARGHRGVEKLVRASSGSDALTLSIYFLKSDSLELSPRLPHCRPAASTSSTFPSCP